MTAITVRVQARGGMFLGQDSVGAKITIKDVASQKILSSGFTDAGGSGNRELGYSHDASQYPIITPPDTYTINWLSAKGGAVKYTADLDLSEPTLIEFSADVPLPPEQGPQSVAMTQWVSPDHNPSVGPGFVILIPGLWVRPYIEVDGNVVRILATVTMMCGCQINEGAPWIPSDFTVSAAVSPSKSIHPIPMKFQKNSKYIADLTLGAKGRYNIAITAYQKSTGNTGVARTTFFV